MFKALKGLEQLPKFGMEAYGLTSAFLPFGMPEVQKALKTLMKAAELQMSVMPAMMGTVNGPINQGFPQFYGTVAIAPFDSLSDVMRSTRGVMLDMYRRPDDVIAACDMYATFSIETPLMAMSASPLAFIPLHKGADRFMSQEQFEKFYWPSLKKLMLGLVEDGYVPAPFAEGSYNHRLETIADFPRNSSLWLFDDTDMKRAGEVLGDTCAIMGNVPASLTTTGTPEQMTEYCQDLIDLLGPSGNFILSNGCQVDEARDENLKAMIACAKASGK
jgi:uroporphyrinogen-III decarboxylase